MKKQRGLRRYYKGLESEIDFDEQFRLNILNPDVWPKYQHWHFDHKGLGNTSFKKRRPHLDKLFRHFDLLRQNVLNAVLNGQLYTILLDFNSSSDALYLHAVDENDTPFPFDIGDLSNTSTLTNKALEDYIKNLEGYEKLYGRAGQAFCLLHIKNTLKPFLPHNLNLIGY